MVVEQPAYPGVGRLGSHAESGLHGRPARARENGTLHWQLPSSGRTPLLRCYQEGLASGTLREVGHGRQPSSTARRRTLGTPGHGSTVTGLPAGSARLRPRTGTRGILSPRRGALKRFPPKFKLSTWATWNASTARTSSSSTKRMCVECGFGVSPVSVRATLPARCSELRVLPKLSNKWWDGYQSQKVVIMEDVDKETIKFLHHHLKIWSDRWGFIGETKGGAVCP